jgi:hypothetical protein
MRASLVLIRNLIDSGSNVRLETFQGGDGAASNFRFLSLNAESGQAAFGQVRSFGVAQTADKQSFR